MTEYEKLANAIVLQAAKDYRHALKHLRKCPNSRDARTQISELERFFRSGWYTALTTVDGEYLITELRREALK
jgi:hypothetical protein